MNGVESSLVKDREGAFRIRVDDFENPEFWMEIDVTPDGAFLAQGRHVYPARFERDQIRVFGDAVDETVWTVRDLINPLFEMDLEFLPESDVKVRRLIHANGKR